MPTLENLMGLGDSPLHASEAAGTGATGLVAVGTTVTDALQLSAAFVAITTSSASTGVILPKCTQGWGMIRNDSGQTIVVYPGVGKTVNAAASSVTLATAKTMIWGMTSATTAVTTTTA